MNPNNQESPIVQENNKKGAIGMAKLELINSMEVVEWSAAGDELEYVLIKNTPENRDKLIEIGASEQEIMDATDDYNHETIDISFLGFAYTEAKWFSPKRGGFISQRPEEALIHD